MIIYKRFIPVFLTIFILLCPSVTIAMADSESGASSPVDLILHGGEVLTLDEHFTKANALAIAKNRIVKVGSDQEVLALKTAATKVVNLQGATAIPGVNDSHIHALDLGKSFKNIDLVGLSFEQVKAALADRVAAMAPGKPIMGNGWATEALGIELNELNKAQLDHLSPDNPVVFHDMSHHVSWVNSKALEQLGLMGKSIPDGVVVERNTTTGEPTGIVHEAYELIEQYTFKLAKTETKKAIINAVKFLNARGVTSYTEPGLSPEQAAIYEELAAEGKLKARVSIHLTGGRSLETIQHEISKYKGDASNQGTQTGMVTVRGVKLFLDGAPPGMTAATIEDYHCCEGVRGILAFKGRTEEEQRNEMLRSIGWLHDNGYQMGIHATGDRSARIAIKGLANSLQKDDVKSKNTLRHYLIHGDRVKGTDISLMAERNIGLSTNPVISYYAGAGLTQLWGDFHGGRHMASKLFMDKGVWTSFGTDSPVVPADWRKNIEYAVLRKGADGVINGAEYRITARQALVAQTKTAAYQDFQEHEKGMLREGMLADITVLEQNILDIAPDHIRDIQALMTIVDGEIVFNSF